MHIYFFTAIVALLVFPGYSADRPFYLVKDWESQDAEILEYNIKKTYQGKELVFPAVMVTEGKYYSFSDTKAARKPTKGSVPILEFSLSYSFTRYSYPRHCMLSLKVFRRDKLPLLSQAVTIQAWDGPTIREYTANLEEPVLRINSWMEGKSETTLEKAPVFTSEQLFLHLRGIPLGTAYREKIWLLGSMLEDLSDKKVYYAEIQAEEGTRTLKDQKTVYVTVTREDDNKLEFWLLADGLHQVVMARMPDGTTYTLDKISRKRYWPF